MYPQSARARAHGRAGFLYALAAAMILGCVPAAASATETLKFGYILAPDSQLGGGAATFAAEIATRTGGRYKVEQYPNAMLGGEVEMMQGVQLGTIDIAFITGAPLAKVIPEAGIFNIPFLFKDTAEAHAVFDGPIGDEYLKKFDHAGLVGLAWGENGLRHLTNSKRPVHTPEDLVGLKLRLPQSNIMSAGFKALGADVKQIPFPEVYGALRSNSVDGEENPIATILASKFAQVQKYLTLTGHVYDPAVILMSKDTFDALSDEDKASFRAAAKAAAQRSRDIASETERTGVATLRAQGMSVIADVDRAAFAAKVNTIAPYLDAQFGHAAIERIKTYRRTDTASGTDPTQPAPRP